MDLIVPVSCENWMKMHVAQFSACGMSELLNLCEAEWKAIEPFIGRPQRILDYGCGLGRMSAYISKKLGYKRGFILFDGDSKPDEHRLGRGLGFSRKTYFYNSLRHTRAFMNANGLENCRIINAEKQPVTDAGQVNLVMSFLSLGFHYPIEDKLDEICSILPDDGMIAATTREGLYSADMFQDRFQEVHIVPVEYYRHYTDREELLVLKGPVRDA